MKHFRLKIHGRVQGVFYRTSAKEKAQELGLVGFVRNEPDGTVLIEVEGSKERLDEFVAWCAEGSASANVAGIDKEEHSVQHYKEFKIEYV